MRFLGINLIFGGPQVTGPTKADIYAALDRLRQLAPLLEAGLAGAVAAVRDLVDKVDLLLDRLDVPAGGLSAADEAALAAAADVLRTTTQGLADAVAANSPPTPTAKG